MVPERKMHHLTRDDEYTVQSWRDEDPKDTFPSILHRMLEVVEAEGNGHVISWNPDGLSFSVHKPKLFADVIMGRYFNQTKYKSFQRQLNLYHFRRNRNGEVKGIYSHPFFVRHDRTLCKFVRRNGRKKKHVPPLVTTTTTTTLVQQQPPPTSQQDKKDERIPSRSCINHVTSHHILQLPYMDGTEWRAPPPFSAYHPNQPQLKEEPFPFCHEAARLSTEPSKLRVENGLDLASEVSDLGPDLLFSGPEKFVQHEVQQEGDDDDSSSSIVSIEVDGVLTGGFLPDCNVRSLEGFSWQTS